MKNPDQSSPFKSARRAPAIILTLVVIVVAVSSLALVSAQATGMPMVESVRQIFGFQPETRAAQKSVNDSEINNSQNVSRASGLFATNKNEADAESSSRGTIAAAPVADPTQTITQTDLYRITVRGADGGNGDSGRGGSGATVTATFQLQAGDVLTLVTGIAGGNSNGGGGGGTAVILTRSGAKTLLIVAGAGGGAQYSSNNGWGGSAAQGTAGGGSGGSGFGAGYGGGGGGFNANGTSGSGFLNGYGGIQGTTSGGGAGGGSYNGAGAGGYGFGGGGGGSGTGGGGGGYGGGNGGGSGAGGGGGSSFVDSSGTNITRTDGSNGGGTNQNGSISVVVADVIQPDTQLTAFPPNPSNNQIPNFSFTGSDNTTPAANLTFECSLDGATFAACTSPKNYNSLLSSGSHNFRVRAIDAADNIDPTPAEYTWMIDTAPPDTQFSPSPSNPTNPNTGFSFTGSDNFTPPENLTFECSFDNATFTVCTSPKNYNNLSDGQHNFKVRAKDAAGNVDPTPANFDWTVDATPPDTQITAQPSNPTNNTNSSFTFGGSDNLTTAANLSFECSLDNATFSACSSPKEYNGLSDGQHKFQVRAKDAAGNVDSTPANYTWTIDTTSPETNITANPTNPTASTDASFSFNGNDSGSGVAKFECSLDGGEFTECETPKTYTDLAEGAHTFQVRAVDAAGNRDQTPASFSWTIDKTAPTVNLTSTAPNQVNAPFDVTATFSDSVTGFSESDISVSNGTAGSLAGSGNTYTFTVTPTAPGTVKISIPAKAAQDAAGNGNTVSNQLTRQFNNLSTLVVTKTADTNDGVCSNSDCSLREAIAAAASGNTITFAGSLGGQTITLSEGWNNAGDASALRIFNNISIQGPASGAGITVAVASGVQKRHIQVESSGGLIVSNLTFSGGYASDYGGSIWNFGALAIRGCTFTQNYAAAEGGAVQSWGGISPSTLIENSTFSGNSSGGVGGAIDLGSAQITIRNATITNNNSTINSGALVIYQTQATMTNTIVAGNAGGDASAANNGAFNAQSTNNLIGTGGAINLQNGVNGNQVGVDAKLAPLGFYGGSTMTHALLPDSPAINAGTSANAPATDQRGKARVGQTDIGAFEAPASLIVTNTANSGAGSLRDTIQAANSTTADESITFAIPATDAGCASGVCTITLGGSELTINDAATAGGLIVSNAGGASRIAVSGNNQSRVFYVAGGGNLTLDNLTIRDGKANGFGGGILSNNGSNLNVLNSTITGNSAPNAAGGGIDAVTSTVTITNSTISGNSASNSVSGSGGGGIRLANSNSTITNSTISNNSSQFRGGGIREDGGSLFLRNTIVAGNTAAVGQPDIINQFATITSNGNNLIGNSTDTLNPINWQASDILNQPALLAPLGFYGGSTQTHALLSNSPAINAGTSTDAPATDQRGASRVGQVDIGAFELNNSQNGGNYRVVLPSGRQGVAYSFILLQDKGAPSSLNISSGLPDGVELQQPSNGSLIIAGTPTQNGTFNFTVGLNYNSNATSVLTDYRLEIFSPLTISGTVTYGLTPAGNPVRFVPAVMMSGSGTGNASTATDSSGKYQLSNLIEGGNYTVTASKTGAVNSSITAFDATLVLRCVAAGDNCDLSNDQKMVADSDNSGTITSFDATQILRFVAANGQNADTDQTGNWKFSPAQLSYQNLNTSQADQNFVAFLIGDVDGDWAP